MSLGHSGDRAATFAMREGKERPAGPRETKFSSDVNADSKIDLPVARELVGDQLSRAGEQLCLSQTANVSGSKSVDARLRSVLRISSTAI